MLTRSLVVTILNVCGIDLLGQKCWVCGNSKIQDIRLGTKSPVGAISVFGERMYLPNAMHAGIALLKMEKAS